MIYSNSVNPLDNDLPLQLLTPLHEKHTQNPTI